MTASPSTPSTNPPPPPSPLYILRYHTSAVSHVYFPTPQLLISSDSDGLIAVWWVPSRRVLVSWQAHAKGKGVVTVEAVCLKKNGMVIVRLVFSDFFL
ncbi:hypothetical protein BKA69DRAFT_1079886 [Paraphysoderma sedebokerense]|nr:hypothetical protein BKA69DRAFT_1079886 [Paraphysoderma sedebokerense]